VDDVDSLALSEAAHFGQALEKLTTLYKFWDYIIIIIVFY
jgi:hypothetical protein